MNTAAVKPADYMTNEEDKPNEQDDGEEHHHDAERSFEGTGLQHSGKEEAVCGSPAQEAVIQATGDDDRGFLQSPYGERRQKAILSSLDRAEEEFKGFGLRSVVESFTQNELSPFNNYNHIDSDMDLRI